MESWLIPAEPVTFVEEIKKSRFITLLAHTDGVEAAKAFVESVRLSILTRVTTVWRGWQVRRMIHNSWGFPTTVNRRARLVNPCFRS